MKHGSARVGRVIGPAALAAALLLAACGEGPAAQSQRPWKSTSQSLSLRSFGYWEGSSGYERDWSQLTAEQLALLDELEVIEPLADCAMDIMGCDLTIVDAEGGERTYHANETNQYCYVDLPFISIESLQPFLDTLACISAKETRDPTGALMPASALVVHPGDGCLHGVFIDGRGTAVRFEVPVTAPGQLTIETDAHESFASQVTLIDVDGTTVLGQGAVPPARPGCSSLAYSFAAAGTYLVEVTSTNAQTGDVFLRIQ